MAVLNPLFYSVFCLVFCVSQVHSAETDWRNLSLDQRAEVLNNLHYMTSSKLPEKSKVIDYSGGSTLSPEDLEIDNSAHRVYIDKIMKTFDQEVSRENIYQSYYTSYGTPQISSLYLLVDMNHDILGSYLSFFQDGRDENGDVADINWTAQVRFDSNGDVFLDDNNQPYDELRYEWSGH